MSKFLKLNLFKTMYSDIIFLPDSVLLILDKKTLDIDKNKITTEINLDLVNSLFHLLNSLWNNRLDKINYLNSKESHYLNPDFNCQNTIDFLLKTDATTLSELTLKEFNNQSVLFNKDNFYYDLKDEKLLQSLRSFHSNKECYYLIEYLDRRVQHLLDKLIYEKNILKIK